MLILPDRNIPRSKVLLPVHACEWRTPSQAQEKNIFGHENITRFCATARLDDGHIVWRGWFDDRGDFDEFMFAWASGTLHQDRCAQRLPTPWWSPDLAGDYPFLQYEFIVTVFRTSGASWTVNADCFGISAKPGEFIDAVAAGASGAAGVGNLTGTTGGGGGAWARITGATPFVLTPLGTLNTQIGVGGVGRSSTNSAGADGTDSWANKSAASAPAATTDGVLAKAGLQGNVSTFGATDLGGLGGPSGTSVGVSKNAGGRGGNINPFFFSATGGGAAAGFDGVGGNGVDVSAASAASAGGTANTGGSDGAGSAGSATTSAQGGDGTKYDATHGFGGGSGAGWVNAATVVTSGRGGNYGGGTGAANSTTGSPNVTGTAGPGLVTIAYQPRSLLAFRRPMRFYTRRF